MGEGEGCARTWVRLPSHPHIYIGARERGAGPLRSNLRRGRRPRGEECLPSQVEALPLRVSPLPCAWALGGGWCPWPIKAREPPYSPCCCIGRGGTFSGPPDPSGILRKLPGTIPEKPNFSWNPNNNFPYINLYLRTIPELLVTSGISSGTPNDFRISAY